MKQREELHRIILKNATNWRCDSIDEFANIRIEDFMSELLGKFNLLPIPHVNVRAFEPNSVEVEDMAVQIDQFIDQYAHTKAGTYSKKLRRFLADKLNEHAR